MPGRAAEPPRGGTRPVVRGRRGCGQRWHHAHHHRRHGVVIRGRGRRCACSRHRRPHHRPPSRPRCRPGRRRPRGIRIVWTRATRTSTCRARASRSPSLVCCSGVLLAAESEALVVADHPTIGTVSDVAPVLGENRSIVRLGLERLRTAPRPGIDRAARPRRRHARPDRPRDRRLRPRATSQRGGSRGGGDGRRATPPRHHRGRGRRAAGNSRQRTAPAAIHAPDARRCAAGAGPHGARPRARPGGALQPG